MKSGFFLSAIILLWWTIWGARNDWSSMELAPTFKLICKKNFNKEMVLTTLRVKERFRQYPLSHGSKVGCNSYFREHLFCFFPELCCKLLFFSSHCRGHGPPDPSKKHEENYWRLRQLQPPIFLSDNIWLSSSENETDFRDCTCIYSTAVSSSIWSYASCGLVVSVYLENIMDL